MKKKKDVNIITSYSSPFISFSIFLLLEYMFIAHQVPIASCSAKLSRESKALIQRLWGLEITSRFLNRPFLSPTAGPLHKQFSLSGPLSSSSYLLPSWLLVLYFRSLISHIYMNRSIYHMLS